MALIAKYHSSSPSLDLVRDGFTVRKSRVPGLPVCFDRLKKDGERHQVVLFLLPVKENVQHSVERRRNWKVWEGLINLNRGHGIHKAVICKDIALASVAELLSKIKERVIICPATKSILVSP